MSAQDVSSILSELLASADEVAARVGYPDPSLRNAYQKHLTMLLAQGYVQVFGTRVEAPDWVPHTGALFPWGAPNHDTIYRFAPVDASGVYRIAGTKGTESVASVMLRRGGANTGQVHGAPLSEVDVLALETDDDNRFSFLLSVEKPAGYGGYWFPLHPETTGVVSRHVTAEVWQKDGIWSIERLDRGPARVKLDEAEIVRSTRLMTSFVGKLNEFLMGHVKSLRDRGLNAFFAEKFPNHGGIADQMYFQGAYEIADDEALILESRMPGSVNYWSVQLLDAFYGGVDTVLHQSSLNGTQTWIDADGRVRFVVSSVDPGVPNWLDAGGWNSGCLLWRWHHGSDYPEPHAKKAKLADVRAHLPADTPRTDQAARDAARSLRISHYQSRRRW